VEINEKELKEVGNNLKATVVDGKLILVIDLSKEVGLSNSGKMMGVGTTVGGFAPLPGGVKGNVWIGKKV